jgi:hypothetical protein
LSNPKIEERKVRARVNEEVCTPIGAFFVTYSNGEAVVSFHAHRPDMVRVGFDARGDAPELRVKAGKRIPTLGQEVTQNGHTFEVTGVRTVEGGRIQLKNESGYWEDFED